MSNLSDTGRPIFRRPPQSAAASEATDEARDDAASFAGKVDNFPVVVSKNYERLGGESKPSEEGEEG